MSKYLRTTFFRAVGDAKRVRIYKYTRRKVGGWLPVFETRREFYCTAKLTDAERVVERLNGGPLPKHPSYRSSLEDWAEDAFAALLGEEDGQTS
jgi:hypothetical protein